MREENFIENISDEKLVEIIDRALRYEKNRKNNKIKPNWLKIASAVAMIALVIGFVNLLPVFTRLEPDNINAGQEQFNDDLGMFIRTQIETADDITIIEDEIINSKEMIENHILELWLMPGLSEEEKQAIEEFAINNDIQFPETDIFGGILYTCEYITVSEIKRIFDGDLPYNKINVTPPVPPYIKGEPVVITEGQLTVIVIDEDYTLPKGKILWLSIMTKLKVAEGVTFTVEGMVETYQEPIIEGKIIGNTETEYNLPLHDLEGNPTGYVNHYIIGENLYRAPLS